jgi:putative two-component system response regulator
MTRILIVDHDEHMRCAMRRLLERNYYLCSVAHTARQAREQLREQRVDLLLCDLNLPDSSGLDLLSETAVHSPGTATVVVSAIDDPEMATSALEHGASGYIIKPFEPNELVINVTNALRRRTLELENRSYRDLLEQAVHERTLALRETVERLERTERDLRLSREETVYRLARTAEFRDDAAGQHIQRVSRYSELLARRIGLDPGHCETIRMASGLHDIGKIAIPDSVLWKPGPLNAEEYAVVKQHAEVGYRVLYGSNSEMLELAAVIAWTHHERFDGRGYPNGLAGDAIPLEGRITAVADVFDVLTSPRPHKKAFPVDHALRIMGSGHGTHFDKELLDTFVSHIDDVLRIKDAYPDREDAWRHSHLRVCA